MQDSGRYFHGSVSYGVRLWERYCWICRSSLVLYLSTVCLPYVKNLCWQSNSFVWWALVSVNKSKHDCVQENWVFVKYSCFVSWFQTHLYMWLKLTSAHFHHDFTYNLLQIIMWAVDIICLWILSSQTIPSRSDTDMVSFS